MAESKNADVAIRVLLVPLTEFRKPREELCLRENRTHRPHGGVRIVLGNVSVDSTEPETGLLRPVYFAHEEIRASISS